MSEISRSIRDQFDELLVGHLFGELSPSQEARFQEILAAFPSLAQEVEQHASLLSVLPKAPLLDPPQAVVDEVLRESRRHLEQLASGRNASFWKSLWSGFRPMFAVSAAAALILVVGYYAVDHAVAPDAPGSRQRMEQELRPAPSASPIASEKNRDAAGLSEPGLFAEQKPVAAPQSPSAEPSGVQQNVETAEKAQAEAGTKESPALQAQVQDKAEAGEAPAAAPPAPKALADMDSRAGGDGYKDTKARPQPNRALRDPGDNWKGEQAADDRQAAANEADGDATKTVEPLLVRNARKTDSVQQASEGNQADFGGSSQPGSGGNSGGGVTLGLAGGDLAKSNKGNEGTPAVTGTATAVPASNNAPAILDVTVAEPSQPSSVQATQAPAPVPDKTAVVQSADEESYVRRRETQDGAVQQAFEMKAEDMAQKQTTNMPAGPSPAETAGKPAKEAEKTQAKKKAEEAKADQAPIQASTEQKNADADCPAALTKVTGLVNQGRFAEAETALKSLESGPCGDKVSDGKMELMRARIDLGRGQRDKAKARLIDLSDDPDAAKEAEILLESVEP